MSNILALEASNVGRTLDLILSLLLVLGLLLIGDEIKSYFVLRVLLHTQYITTTFFQVFLQTSDLGLELFIFLNKVSINKRTRGSRRFIVRATRHGEQFITRCTNIM